MSADKSNSGTKIQQPTAGGLAQIYGAQLRADLELGRLLRLGVITVEFALVVLAIRLLNIETQAFELVATVALGGFLVHHFLPAAWRLSFFAALSVASVPMVFGWEQGAWLLGMGGLLIALCHVPVAMWMRIALVLAAALAMAAARKQVLPWVSPYIPASIWPILASMFMFRLIVYIYDLQHRAAPFSVPRALSYFFMLPNVCFPLFPVVDYKSLQRSAYNADALRLYQTGVKWMARGLVHLALYKIIYFKGVIEPSEAVNGLGAAHYMIATYLLYLKISGLFHLVVGLLHMYGFGLPETHHLYLFSSSFTDFWRRINIYWKDFIQKLVFNPVYFSLRKLGETRAVVAATLIAFTATWLFHSYQWFWIRGDFPIVWSDLVFWLGLGVVVLVNVLLESRRGRQRSLESQTWGLRDNAMLVLKIAGTFTTMCILWTIWSTPNVEELGFVWRAALNSSHGDLLLLAAIPLGVGVLGALFRNRKREVAGAGVRSGDTGSGFWLQAAGVSAVACAFIVVALRPTLLIPVSPELATLVSEVRSGNLNPIDLKKLQRGYYEDLGDVTRFNDELWKMYGGRPKDWDQSSQTIERADAIGLEYAASTAQPFKGALRTINSHGMRDREYAIERGPDTFRIALVGASHDAGSGVKDDETYENLVEDRLNRELGAPTGRKFEVLNFSHGGYDPVQKLAVIEQRIFGFKPDVVLYVANSSELAWAFKSVPRLSDNGLLDQFPFVRNALARAQIKLDAGKPLPDKIVLDGKLAPYAEDALRAVFEIFRERALSRNIRPAVVILEIPDDGPSSGATFERLADAAQSAKLPVLNLQGSFAGVADRKSLWIAPWDSHTNAQGHRLLAERLYSLLMEQGLVPMQPQLGAERRSEGSR